MEKTVVTDVSTSVAMGTPFQPLLAKLTNFARLNAADVSRVRALPAQVKIVPKSFDIGGQVNAVGSLHLIADGWAIRFKGFEDGRRQITGLLLPGDFIDWPGGGSGLAGHTVETITRCEILSFAAPSIEALLYGHDGLSDALQCLNLFEQTVLREWVVSLGRRDASGRIAHLICEVHERLRMAGRAADGRFDFPITQSDLADASGLTAVHVNRVIKRLRQDKLIDLSSRIMTITDEPSLRNLAQFSPDYLHVSTAHSGLC